MTKSANASTQKANAKTKIAKVIAKSWVSLATETVTTPTTPVDATGTAATVVDPRKNTFTVPAASVKIHLTRNIMVGPRAKLLRKHGREFEESTKLQCFFFYVTDFFFLIYLSKYSF